MELIYNNEKETLQLQEIECISWHGDYDGALTTYGNHRKLDLLTITGKGASSHMKRYLCWRHRQRDVVVVLLF